AKVLNQLRRLAVELSAVAAALSDERALSPENAYRRDPLRAAVLDGLTGDPVALLTGMWPTRAERSRALANDLGGLASDLGQAAAAARGDVSSWSDQSEAVLVAQGEASAVIGRLLAGTIVPANADLAERLGAGGRVLDVGSGIGVIAVVLAEAFR